MSNTDAVKISAKRIYVLVLLQHLSSKSQFVYYQSERLKNIFLLILTVLFETFFYLCSREHLLQRDES